MLKNNIFLALFSLFLLACGEEVNSTSLTDIPNYKAELQQSSDETPIDNERTALFLSLPKNAVNGEEIIINVEVKNVKNLFGAPYYLTFDPDKLLFIEAEAGGFLGESPKNPEDSEISQAVFLYALNEENSWLITGYSRIGSESGGVDGSGLLTKIKFKILSSGQAKFNFLKVDFRTPTLDIIEVDILNSALVIQ